ncbi:MAG: thioesterase superfamily protein [Thermoleophilia bacterium]|nr:thioesterase superfamily protein [Thermoleophilia bacterium]MCZ4497268.1 thioesterase superfamily protein [Thermoleophilia bacterium]
MTDHADPFSIEAIRERTAMGALGIDLVEASAERVVLTCDVGPKVHQPYGFLHGGVSALIAETGASIGAGIAAGDQFRAFGIEINANHVRPVREGVITSTSTPIRQGRSIAVWDTRIETADGKLVCASRCTIALQPIEG